MSADPGIVLDLTRAGAADWSAVLPAAREAREQLESGSGPGAGLTGWLDLPGRVAGEELAAIERAAERIRELDALVVCGIGGSYLGARAVIDALSARRTGGTEVLYAGNNLDATHHAALLRRLEDKRYAIAAISKSGSTTEPLLALRLLLADLERRRFAADVDRMVYAVTGPSGALAELASQRGWTAFEVPADVGGRFSVLTGVGLLPAAAAGCDVGAILDGAQGTMELLRDPQNDGADNPALQYAALRQAARRAGRQVEALLYGAPSMGSLAEWWKQLFGESEGKGGGGLLPTAIQLTTDLHSLGQWLQQGPPIALETALDVVAGEELLIPTDAAQTDRPDQLGGRGLHEVNRLALEATLEAHAARGTPCARIRIPQLTEQTLGGLLYFFEYACAVSAYVQGVNPFDQPGVEHYKRNMRRLLEGG